MAESITFNNATYIIPDVGESGWGQNLTNYFVAIPQGAYQLSGGTAPLTADLSFGTNFGIFSKYFTSTTSTPATAGAVRLARRTRLNGATTPTAPISAFPRTQATTFCGPDRFCRRRPIRLPRLLERPIRLSLRPPPARSRFQRRRISARRRLRVLRVKR